jgi:chromosome segregation ATPase
MYCKNKKSLLCSGNVEIANNDLPSIEHTYKDLKVEVNWLENQKQSSVRIIQDYSSQITALGKRFDEYCLSCEEKGSRLIELKQKFRRLESLVKQFKNNNREYTRITRIVEEKVCTILSSRKKPLELAALSLFESIRKNQEKYSSLYSHDTSDNYTVPYYHSYYMDMYGQQLSPKQHSRDCSIDNYVAMIMEEADKFLERIVKNFEDEIVSEYGVSTSQPTS